MKQAQRKAIADAEIKLSLISAAIHNTFEDKSINAYFERISKNPVTFSDGSVRYVNVSTLKGWKKTFLEKGFEGLQQKKRSDFGSSRKIDNELAGIIQDFRYTYPKMPATCVRLKLIEKGYIDKCEISEATFQRFFKNNPLKDIDVFTQSLKDRKAFEAEWVNGIWQADSLHGPYIEGKKVYLQAIIDDKSRKIVCARFVRSDSAAIFQLTLKYAISSHGLCQKLFVDNGSAYKNAQLSAICGNLGIVVVHAAIRDGAAKGKIERFNRTLRSQFLSGLDRKDKQNLDALNAALASWIKKYNNTYNRGINNIPLKVFESQVDKIKFYEGNLDKAFLNEVTRKVAKDSTIRLDKVLYDVPLGFVGKKVIVKYDPNIEGEIYIEDKDKHLIKISKTDKVANSKTKRVKTNYRFDFERKV